jgi:hypothetical protein
MEVLVGVILWKRPVLWAGITLLLGLAGAAWGLAVNNPEFIRGGVALGLTVAPLLLLVQPTYARAFSWGRVNVLLALAWTALAVSSFGLWRWAGDPVYANALAWICGTFALLTAICAWLGVKYPELPPVHLLSGPESPEGKKGVRKEERIQIESGPGSNVASLGTSSDIDRP